MKSPAFQFYAQDFLIGTDTMSSAEVGLYIRMLCYQWVMPEYGLPSDPTVLRRLMRWECDGMPEAVMKKFNTGEDGLLRNPRLEAIRREREEYCANQAANANARWAGNGLPKPEPKPRQPKPTLEEVKLLAAKAGLPDREAEKFFNYYEAAGWRVGKNPMKSVSHAIGGWKMRWEEARGSVPKTPNKPRTAAEQAEYERKILAESRL